MRTSFYFDGHKFVSCRYQLEIHPFEAGKEKSLFEDIANFGFNHTVPLPGIGVRKFFKKPG
jgi:hypothetical protein